MGLSSSPRTRPAGAPAEPGVAARELAASLIVAVLHEGRALEDALSDASPKARNRLPDRDRAFARLIATTVLRRVGELDAVLKAYLAKPLPAKPPLLRAILLVGAAQLLFLGTPAYAAVDRAVEQCRRDASTRRFDGLVNAVLRRVSREGANVFNGLDGARINLPDWLFKRWADAYGADLARAIAQASLAEAPLDLTVKSNGAQWAARLDGVLLPTGSVRLARHGRVEDLPGYGDGEWWVQDAAAALPALLLGDVRGLAVADLCAAPGGKTAQLAAAGARVTAVDISAERLARLSANLERLRLKAEVVQTDAAVWNPDTLFDAVLLDAPCTATGAIRRHPDIPHLRRPSDIPKLATAQERLLDHAVKLVKPGGLLVYCVCSLEPEEGLLQVARGLLRNPAFARIPVSAAELGGETDWLDANGDLRTLPCHSASTVPALRGLDGFYAARLRRER